MFASLKLKILLGLYIFILASIPVGAYLASQATQLKSRASEGKRETITKQPKTASSSAKTLDRLSALRQYASSPAPSSPATPATTSAPEPATVASTFGPTLSLKVLIEGRVNNQSTRLFVGIINGTNTQSPQYLLSFTVDVPASGAFDNLSLAGLTAGNTYTAVLKGDAQIATSSAFVMNPAVTSLNRGQPLFMINGDLNQDNVINNLDLAILQAAFGSSSRQPGIWNPIADLNKDGIINNMDLAIVNKNQGKTGITGAWISPPPVTSTPSASLSNPAGSPGGSSGYWVWIPK